MPFIRSEFAAISNDVIMVSKHFHPEIFGETKSQGEEVEARIKDYIKKSIKGKEHENAD